MARGKATQGKVDYLISLGFEIKSKTAAQDIKELYSNVKALENAFASIGEKLPKISNVGNFADYFQQATSRLNEMGNTQYATFKSMQGNIIQVQKAMGDLSYVIEKFNENGLENSQLFKSKAALDPRNTDFFSLDEQKTLDKQTEAYTLKVESLGDDLEKTLIKLGIQDALQKTNTELANFLKDNLNDIENYVTKTQTMYNSEGKAIKSFVELAVNEYGKLKIAMNYKDVSADNGNIQARIATRGVQSYTTDNLKAYNNLKSAMQQQSELEQRINKLSVEGQTQIVSVLKEKKSAIDANVNALQQEYKLLIKNDPKYSRDVSEITKEIQQTERLNRANQQAAEEKQNQKKIVNELKNDLNSYLKVLSETKRIESSGDNTYGARLEYNKEILQQLAQSINQYISNAIQLDTNTDELSVNFEELSRVFSNNKTALEQLTQIYKNYNNEVKKQDTTISHQEEILPLVTEAKKEEKPEENEKKEKAEKKEAKEKMEAKEKTEAPIEESKKDKEDKEKDLPEDEKNDDEESAVADSVTEEKELSKESQKMVDKMMDKHAGLSKADIAKGYEQTKIITPEQAQAMGRARDDYKNELKQTAKAFLANKVAQKPEPKKEDIVKQLKLGLKEEKEMENKNALAKQLKDEVKDNKVKEPVTFDSLDLARALKAQVKKEL